MTASRLNKILLFDVDGTLSVARKQAEPWMIAFLKEIRQKVEIGFVGGSDLDKIKEQLGDDCASIFDYAFSQNGLLAMKGGDIIGQVSLKDEFDNEQLKSFISESLKYIAELDIPIKRGTFIEFRTGMLNVSPIGRNCSQKERDDFEQYDKQHKVREHFITFLKGKFPDFPVTYSIGGQISFDVFPNGWDKTFCLRYLRGQKYDEIHFFGDKTYKGGNDHEIFESDETIGHTVVNPEDTKTQVLELLQ